MLRWKYNLGNKNNNNNNSNNNNDRTTMQAIIKDTDRDYYI